MTNEIGLVNNNGQAVVSSRQIAENFSRRHADVIRSIESVIDSTQNCAQWFFATEYTDASGKVNKEYLIDRDGFTLLVMGFSGKKAMTWKIRYIDAFSTMEKQIKTMQQDSYMIDNPIARARKWADEQEEKNKQIAERDETIALLQPKAELADRLAGHEGLLKVGDAARTLGYKKYGQNNLFRLLYRKKILIDSRHVYQAYIDKGYFAQIESLYIDPNTGEQKIGLKVRVTQRGMEFLARLIRRDIENQDTLAIAV